MNCHMNYKLSIIFLGISLFLFFFILVGLFYPVEVVRPNAQPYKVLTKKVVRGGQLVYQVDSCKYYDLSATVRRSFIHNGVQYPAIEADNHIRKGCGKTNVSITVPNYVPLGKNYIQLDVTYHVNFLHDTEYHFVTEEFVVE